MIDVILIPFDDSKPLEENSVSWDENYESFDDTIKLLLEGQDYLETPLVRPRQDVAGLYVYFNNSEDARPNIRATRLSMACGLLSLRLYGNVLLVRGFGGRWESLSLGDVQAAACISPDLRKHIQEAVLAGSDAVTIESIPASVPMWLRDAAQHNYHDSAELAKVTKAFKNEGNYDGDSTCSSDASSSENIEAANKPLTEFVAKSSLCLHCRSLSSSLCPDCEGAYFCIAPKSCRDMGWSHSCLCPTWKVYTSRRNGLSEFPFFGLWQSQLTGRDFQTREEPYAAFLQSLGIDNDYTSWWATETKGWAGGESESAQKVDASIRKSYAEGFSPITDIPPERKVTQADLDRSGLEKKNSLGLTILSSWMDYYKLRGLSKDSPVALLLTFPLTIYFAIQQFGEVPVTVARMLKRPLRIHVVGAEKELNFLDMFQEVSFLLPADLKVELVFIVRQDMLPSKCQEAAEGTDSKYSLKLPMTSELTIILVSGTYGDSLDPRFDCGSGPPDMLVALNAGLYAYESWRSVVAYLYNNPGVVGVFSDYNEYSGVNCAAMGGGNSRDSLSVNPFRQPLALPVFSMNLPQFSNGFIYAFNIQELE